MAAGTARGVPGAVEAAAMAAGLPGTPGPGCGSPRPAAGPGERRREAGEAMSGGAGALPAVWGRGEAGEGGCVCGELAAGMEPCGGAPCVELPGPPRFFCSCFGKLGLGLAWFCNLSFCQQVWKMK